MIPASRAAVFRRPAATRKWRWRSRVPAIVGILLLGGCTALPVTRGPAEISWDERREALAALDTWALRGRVAVSTGNEAWHAGLYWRQDGEAFQVSLSSPLGQGLTRISGVPGRIQVDTADGGHRQGTDVDELLGKQIGWRVPIEALRYWVRGIPAPAAVQTLELSGQGQLIRLQQAGWQIDYRDYMTVDGLTLPRRVFLTRETVTTRLIITSWTPTGPAAPTALP